MTLTAGKRLGPYEILSAIGAGGMGEVYKGKDTRLNRAVAVKVLPSHFSTDPERKQRFEREARAVASLRHPNICVLHDVGVQEGIDFLVMEYLEGETLAARLEKGPLALDQALRVGIEIAGALDNAHRQGITHRDLKPGNIMLTKSGSKLLDFGLAKPKPIQQALSSASNLATRADVTAEGTILGTLRYMAPEQLEGKEADARTDIFAFGAVLYEMVTGRKAFEGKSQASLIAAILEHDPQPMSSFQSVTPVLDHTVQKCLAKDPEDRWQTMRDVWHELKWIAESGAQAAALSTPATDRTRAMRRWALPAVVICILTAAITGIAVWNLKPLPPPQLRPLSRFTITLPPGERLAGLDQPALALSSDGTRLAYVASQGGNPSQLHLREMDSLESKPIAGTEGAVNPFFSPDGQWVGFFAGGKLKKVSVSGGAAMPLANTSFPRGANWGSQGMIVYVPSPALPLQQISQAGGTPQPLTRLEKGEISHRFPEFLPTGKAVLFAASAATTNWTNAQVAVQSLETGERRNLIGGMNPRYALSAHLVYAHGGALMAAPFDAERLVLTGAAVPVVENVRQSIFSGGAQYSFSATGSLVYVPGGLQGTQRRLVWVSRNGAEQVLPAAPAHAYRNPRISPDGRQVAVAIEEEQTQVWLYDFTRETLTPLTFEGYNNNPAWTPDGKRIVFQSTRAGPPNLFWQLADGSGGIERLTTNDYINSPNSWTPGGQVLAFAETQPDTQLDIWTLRLSDRKAEPWLRTRSNEGAPQFSPDGRWLAYVSDESNRYEIYVQLYPGPGGKRQITTEGGTEPVWNRNGRELFYRNGNKMMAVDVTTHPGFSTGKPKVLFEGPYVPTAATFPNYDVTADGQRFLILKTNEQDQAATQIHVVLNWFEELKRRVPVK